MKHETKHEIKVYLYRDLRGVYGPLWISVDVRFKGEMVERKGIEPSTFALRTRRSPN